MIMGHLRVRVGDDVRINGTTTFSAAVRAQQPLLEIGDRSYIGYQVTIAVGSKVAIGRHVLIANRVFLCADDGHPLESEARRTEPGSGTGTITIGDDVWLGEGAIVLKDLHIGDGAVVAAGSVVTADVPAHSVVGGNPARILRELGRPDEPARLDVDPRRGAARAR